MRWLPAGCRQRMLPAETKDDRLRETGKPPGQNSPTRGSCPNTGSQSAPREGESKGRPRRERLFLHSQIGLKQSREALPRRRRWGRRPRHGDTETPRRGEAASLSPSGGEQKQGARSGSFIKTLPRLAGVQARSGVPGPGWLSLASLVVPPPGAEGPPPPVQPEAGEGLAAQPCPRVFSRSSPTSWPWRAAALLLQESPMPV